MTVTSPLSSVSRDQQSPTTVASSPLVFMPNAALATGQDLGLSMTPAIEHLLASNCVVACGISGGKDGTAMALRVAQYLDLIGHTGPRVLVHADLGRVEWKDSLPSCQRLADHLGWELMVVKRAAGDLMDRWQVRWRNNVARYADLSCVKLILPWSTPAMRFCTSELKGSVIMSALRKRFPTSDICNVTGVRAQESSARKKMPISKVELKLQRKNTAGMSWNAIHGMEIEAVYQVIGDAGLALHEGYTKYGSSRISCAFCILGSFSDQQASASCEDNHAIYVEMVELEAQSTYAFQGDRWLADLRPDLLPADLASRIAGAKLAAAMRVELEARIPKHLLYVKGWPTVMPTREEANLLADIRVSVAGLVGIEAQHLTGEAVLQRYAYLMSQKAIKDAAGGPAGPELSEDTMEGE